MTIDDSVLKQYNKLYHTSKVLKDDLIRFQEALKLYFNKIKLEETEENLKNLMRDLFKSIGYGTNPYDINTKKRKDYVITKNNTVEIIIEVKSPKNTNEMISENDLNKKALHELIHYYFEERQGGNIEIKYLVISNGIEWFLFNEKNIQSFYTKYKEKYKNWDWKSTNDIYSEIKEWVKPFIEDFKPIHFSLDNNFKKSLNNEIETNNHLINLYKLLHPNFLLKEFTVRDANELNEEFYRELLHIMGLKENDKTLIEIDETNKGCLSHNIVSTLISDKGYEQNSEKLKEDTMELLITWINRILFLKLFEAQLISFNRDDGQEGKNYHFLNAEKIPDFGTLKSYFFEIFGKSKVGENATIRSGRFAEEDFFKKLPYLNSSLFEISDLEIASIQISNLDDSKEMMHLRNKKPIKTLHYLFEFLDSYDFSNESSSNKVVEKKEPVINAAVLGLIFEKLNGYKEGSFYTPGFITGYIAKETIEKPLLKNLIKNIIGKIKLSTISLTISLTEIVNI